MDIEEISDRLEIEQLMVRYVDAIDSKDWDLLDTVFTKDAFLDYESSGGPEGKGNYPEVKSWLKTSLAIFPDDPAYDWQVIHNVRGRHCALPDDLL